MSNNQSEGELRENQMEENQTEGEQREPEIENSEPGERELGPGEREEMERQITSFLEGMSSLRGKTYSENLHNWRLLNCVIGFHVNYDISKELTRRKLRSYFISKGKDFINTIEGINNFLNDPILSPIFKEYLPDEIITEDNHKMIGSFLQLVVFNVEVSIYSDYKNSTYSTENDKFSVTLGSIEGCNCKDKVEAYLKMVEEES
jgi:hypothetical protein